MKEPTGPTPGPWEWYNDELFNAEYLALLRRVETGTRNGEDIPEELDNQTNFHPYSEAIVQTDGGYYGPNEFDRPLIAAAPDMLAALKGVVRVADRATVEFDAARAAIAKAEGK